MNNQAAKNIRAIARRLAPTGSSLQTRTGYSKPRYNKRGKLIRKSEAFRNYEWFGYRRIYQKLKLEYLRIPGKHRAHWVASLMDRVGA